MLQEEVGLSDLPQNHSKAFSIKCKVLESESQYSEGAAL